LISISGRMSVIQVQKCMKCILQRGITVLSVQNRKFQTSRPVRNSGEKSNIENRTVQDASKFLSTILGGCNSGSIFAGTGQYHELKDQDRILMLNFAENFLADPQVSLFDTTPILDCCVKHADVDTLIEDVKLRSPLPVYNGEVDFINSSSWQYGFTLKPFSIFSGDERICFISENTIHTSIDGHTEIIQISDVDYVGLWVSEEPYNERRLLFGLKNRRSKTLIFVEKSETQCDLGTLTVDTEWMMKTAALLCVNITRKGNERVHLKVSPALQPANNQWVAMRQKIWIEMIQKNTWEKDF